MSLLILVVDDEPSFACQLRQIRWCCLLADHFCTIAARRRWRGATRSRSRSTRYASGENIRDERRLSRWRRASGMCGPRHPPCPACAEWS